MRPLLVFSSLIISMIVGVSCTLPSFAADSPPERYQDESLFPLYRYEPMYFISGTPDTKVNLSFKIRPISAWPVYLAYTQLMFWELDQESRPFKDINYRPEAFYRYTFPGDDATTIDFSPLEHESNGKDGAESRSWNRAYLRGIHEWKSGDTKILGSLQVWAPYAVDKQMNPDIAKYRGLYEVRVRLSGFLGPYFDRQDLELRLYPGGSSRLDPLKGGRELTLFLKGRSPPAFFTALAFQFFQGRGESMLDYKQNIVGLRVGFGI